MSVLNEESMRLRAQTALLTTCSCSGTQGKVEGGPGLIFLKSLPYFFESLLFFLRPFAPLPFRRLVGLKKK